MRIPLLLALSASVLCGCSVVVENNRQTNSNNTHGGKSTPKQMDLSSQVTDAETDSNKSINRKSNCSRKTNYGFVQVESESRGVSDPIKQLRVMVGNQVLATLELPVNEVKNLEILSTKNTRNGFEIIAAWGGGLNHYEYVFEFTCRENDLVLYNVIADQFSTTDPESGNYLDRKVSKNISIDPNVPIQDFLFKDYLN